MSGVDIAVTVVVCAAALAALGFILYRKLRHKGGCCDCGDCCGCSHCKDCNSEKSEPQK